MSLDISSELLQQAQAGQVSESAFVESIRRSLPYAFEIVEGLVEQVIRGEAEWAEHSVSPPN